MPLILNKAFFLVMMSLFANAQTICEQGQVRSIAKGKTQILDAHYCYDSTRTRLFSKGCENQTCRAFSFPEQLTYHEFLSPNGSPAFAVCRKIGGLPEIIEFKADGAWHKLDRCLFPDGSYVNSDFLAHFYFHVR